MTPVLASSGVALVIAVVSAAAVIAAVATVAVLMGKREAALERRLAGYELASNAGRNGGSSGQVPDSSLMGRAVTAAGSFAERAGLHQRVELLLSQAEVPLRAAELLFYWPVGALALGGFGYLVRGPIGGVVLLLVGVIGPLFYLRRRRKKILSLFESQLPDTLGLFASSLRAGFSLVQGLEAVAEETTDPMARELQRVFTEVRLGRSLEDSLEEVAVRMESQDLAWAVMAIGIQREVGGNLSELLDTVAETMVSRDRLRQEIKSLTAEGRMSGVVLAIFPPAFAGLLFLVQPDYMGLMFKDFFGIAALIAGGIGAIIGWFWLRKIVNIEV